MKQVPSGDGGYIYFLESFEEFTSTVSAIVDGAAKAQKKAMSAATLSVLGKQETFEMIQGNAIVAFGGVILRTTMATITTQQAPGGSR